VAGACSVSATQGSRPLSSLLRAPSLLPRLVARPSARPLFLPVVWVPRRRLHFQMTTLLRGFNSALSKVSDVLALNQATLSGAIDVVVVETPALHDVLDARAAASGSGLASSASAGSALAEALDLEAPHADASEGDGADGSSGPAEFDPATDGESLVCTPFHVRFGKLQLLRSREKLVSIRVNDEPMPFCMKLESDGEAYFVLPCSEPPLEEHMLVSPVNSPQMGPQTATASPQSAPQGNAASLAAMARSLPELDLASPGSVAAVQQSFPGALQHPGQVVSPPASGDAVVAAVRAAGENPASHQDLLLASTIARQSVAANEAAALQSSSRPSSVASSPSRRNAASAAEDDPGRQLFQIGFGSAAPRLVRASSASVSNILSPGGTSLLNSPGAGDLAEPHHAPSKSRGWMRSIFGAMTGGVFSGPETRAVREGQRREHRQLEQEQQAANALLFAELAAAASQSDKGNTTLHPPLSSDRNGAPTAAASPELAASILSAAATADPTPPSAQPDQSNAEEEGEGRRGRGPRDETKSAEASPLASPHPLPHPAVAAPLLQLDAHGLSSSSAVAPSSAVDSMLMASGGVGGGSGIAVAWTRDAEGAEQHLPHAADSSDASSRTLPSSANISRVSSTNSNSSLPPPAASVQQSMSPSLASMATPSPAGAAMATPANESVSWPAASLGPFPYSPSASSDSSSSSDGEVALKLSLCCSLLSLTDGVANEAAFRRYAVSYALLCAQPTLYAHPQLVVLHPASNMLYPARLALPMLIGQLAFNKPLTLSQGTIAQIQAGVAAPAAVEHAAATASTGENPAQSLLSPPSSSSTMSSTSSNRLQPPPAPYAPVTGAGHKHAMSEVVLSTMARSGLAASSGAGAGGAQGAGAPVATAVPSSAGGGRVGWREWLRGKQPTPLQGVPPKSASAGPDMLDAQSPQGFGPSQYNSTESSRAQSPMLSSTASPSMGGGTPSGVALAGLSSPMRSSAGLGGPQPAQDVFRHPSGLWLRKTKRPSVSQLARMNLRPGRNRVVFSVNSSLQGRQYVECSIFLLKASTRLVVSDIDGTVTRSDVFGQLMPLLGRDWSHGGVASLFASIARNGFQLVYLTSRAIGQANITRQYIRGLKQDGMFLPDGPILMSPDRLMASFRREVIDRQPQIFKIMALTELKHLFPSWHNPFYAGFGNRVTDVLAYKAVGVPLSKIFIINPAGNIQSVNNAYVKTYTQLADMGDAVFPPADAHRVEKTFAAAARAAAAASGTEEESNAEALEREAARRATLTAEQIMLQLHQAEIDVAAAEAGERETNRAAASAAASALTSPQRVSHVPGASSHTNALNTMPHHDALAPQARLLPSTDADLHFNAFAYWRDEIPPLPRETAERTTAESEEEDEDDLEAQRDVAEAAAAMAGQPAAPSADGAAPMSSSATSAFAARVQRQVQAGSAEAHAQAAAAEAAVTGEALRDLKQPTKH